MKTEVIMMAGDKEAHSETFDTLEEADEYAASSRKHSHGITKISFRLIDEKIILGYWSKGSNGQWFYRCN